MSSDTRRVAEIRCQIDGVARPLQLTGTVNNSYPGRRTTLTGSTTPLRVGDPARRWEACDPLHRRGGLGELASDASKFPSSVLGKPNRWPGDGWLDIRQLSALELLMTTHFHMCVSKGFAGIEPDNIDDYENETPGSTSPLKAGSPAVECVAREARSLDLAVVRKNEPTRQEPRSDISTWYSRAMQRAL